MWRQLLLISAVDRLKTDFGEAWLLWQNALVRRRGDQSRKGF
jgi:hypothetical protein